MKTSPLQINVRLLAHRIAMLALFGFAGPGSSSAATGTPGISEIVAARSGSPRIESARFDLDVRVLTPADALSEPGIPGSRPPRDTQSGFKTSFLVTTDAYRCDHTAPILDLATGGRSGEVKSVKIWKAGITREFNDTQWDPDFLARSSSPSQDPRDLTATVIDVFSISDVYQGIDSWPILMGLFPQRIFADPAIVTLREDIDSEGNLLVVVGNAETSPAPKPSGQRHEYYLDPKKDYAPVKWASRTENGILSQEGRTTYRFDAAHGYIPISAMATRYLAKPETYLITVNAMEINPQIEDSSFQMPSLPPGTTVTEHLKGGTRTYKIDSAESGDRWVTSVLQSNP